MKDERTNDVWRRDDGHICFDLSHAESCRCALMYYCLNCHDVFEKLVTVVERHGLETPPYETYPASSCCHDSNFEEAKVCERCGAYIPESQSLYGMCAECERNAADRFRFLFNNEFDEVERAYILENLDVIVL